MFRTLTYPSSGAYDYSVELPHWPYCSWFDVCWSFRVVGLEWYPFITVSFSSWQIATRLSVWSWINTLGTNFAKSTIVHTNTLFSTYVQFSQFCVSSWSLLQTDSHSSSLTTFSHARPLLNRNKSTSLPSGSRTVAYNTCSLNTMQYNRGPWRNIWRGWRANCCDV